jgi:hypothetical protein
MKKKAKLHPFLKMAGVKTEKEFYDKYPTDEHFFEAHPQAKYGAAMRAADGIELPDDSSDSQDQNQSTKTKTRKFQVSGGDNTWNPFAKDNAWNTGQGVSTTDIFGTTAALASTMLPYQPVKMNKPLLPLAVGSYGTGSHAAFEDGGYIAEDGINIDPSKKGTFTAAATKHGKSVQGFASQVLANKENYSPAMVKKANFARNAAKWKKADGGKVGMPDNPGFKALPPAVQQKIMSNMKSGGAMYAEYGAPMISNVKPSKTTYFHLMTREGRQLPETPNFMAADGMTMPVTDADRQAYNNYVIGMRKLPGYDSVNWQHDQTFQKQAAQQLGFDYSKAAAIQADMQARNQSMPGTIKGVQPGDAWGGDPNWVGNRERQKEYVKYGYEHFGPKGNLIGQIEPGFTPLTEQQFNTWTDQNRGMTSQQNLPPTTNPMDPEYVAPGTPAVQTPRATGLAATGFPTREEAIAKYKAKKAAGNVDNTPEMKYSIDTGNADYMKYGGPIMGGFDARLNQNYPYRMTNQYPHKIGGQYHPYDHTIMEAGGIIPIGKNGLQVEGNQFRYLSPQTIELVGPKHTQGGIDIAYNGNTVEAEGGETFHVDNNGMWSGGGMAQDGTAGPGIVGGNLYVPGTNTKFKDAFKDVAKGERKTSKLQDKASKFLNEYGSDGMGSYNKYQAPAFNYGYVMSDAYEQNKAKDEAVKTALTETQNKMLELGGMIDPENGAKKVSQMFKGKAKWGANMMAKKGKKITGNLSPTSPNLNNTGRYMDAWSRGTENFAPTQSGTQSNISGFGDWALNNQGNSSTVIDRLPVIIPTEHPVVNFVDPFPTIPETEEEPKAEEKKRGLRNKFRVTDYIPEIAAGFEKAEPYQSMQVQPYLEPEYNVSFQNEKNAIQSAFAPALKSARTPAQQAAIAAQMAEQLANVDAKELQFNQQNMGGIRGRNLQEMRGVRDTNLKLAMDAYEKTLGGKEAARSIRQAAAKSLSTKEQARRAKNLELAMYEDYTGWQKDPDGKWHFMGPKGELSATTVSLMDPSKKETKTSTKETDPKTGKTKSKEQVKEEDYYGGKLAYFGIDMPAGIPRMYFGGGAVGGAVGGGMGMSMHGGMHGLPGQQGSMASRYSPGGDSSYYQKKKKKRKN